MNKNKRLLSVLVCIAMVLSMFSGFAYAAGSGEAVSEQPALINTELTGTADQTGAKPTTNVAAPAIDANTFVIDASAQEGVAYTLNWNGTEYADMFTYGTNLFTSFSALLSVAPVGATVLVKSFTESGTVTITKAMSFYTEAYNAMPFVVGTAFDGSDWSENATFTAKTLNLGVLKVAVTDSANSGTVELFGFTYTGAAVVDLNGSTAPVDVTVYNSHYKLSGSNPAVSMSSYAQRAASIGATFTMKNTYISGSSTRIFTEWYCDNVIVDGLYMTSATMSGNTGTGYFKQANVSTQDVKGVFKNMNLQGINFALYPQGYNGDNWFIGPGKKEIEGSGSRENLKVISFENNTLHNAGTHNSSCAFYVLNNNYSKTVITGNRVVFDTARQFVGGTGYGERVSFRIYNNYVQGATVPNTHAASICTLSGFGNQVYDNYTDGKQYVLQSTKNTSGVKASDWYLDSAMSVRASELLTIANPTVTGGYFFQNGFNATVYIPADGNGTNLVLDNATATWKNSDGTEVAASAVTAGTYTLTVNKIVNDVECSVDYVITVETLIAPAFASSFVDPEGLIDAKKAIYLSYDFASAADHTIVAADWNGQTYTFVKGVNLFKNLGDAYAYAEANGIYDAHYLMIDYFGIKGDSNANPQIQLPGKYFTKNYNKKVYTKSDAATDPFGLEWKSNVNTGAADSFNTADGITGRYFGLGKAKVSGDYEFYGFTVNYQIEMCATDGVTRSTDVDINVSFINTYLKPTSGVNFITGGYSSVDKAKAYNDSLTFKDSFFAAENTTGFYRSDAFPPANFTLDGVFADFGGQTMVSTYLHQYGDFYSFNIVNCNFRNGIMPLYIRGRYNSGDNNKVADSKVLNISDNIFYDFSLYGATNFGAFYLCGFNKFDFNNNKLYARSANSGLYYPGYAAYGQGAESHPDITMSVVNNTLIGINGAPTIGRYVNPSRSTVGYNFVTPVKDDPADGVTASGEDFTIKNTSSQKDAGSLYSEDYYLDFAKTVLASERDSILNLYVPNGGFYKNGRNATIYLSSDKTLADVTTVTDNTTLFWTNTDGTELDLSTVTKTSVGTGFPCKAKVTLGDITATLYVTVVPNTIEGYAASTYARDENGHNRPTHPSEKTVLEDIPHLSGGFVDEAGLIDPTNAAFIDGDATYGSSGTYYGKVFATGKTIQSGEFKAMQWNDKQYIAMFGTNFFGSVDVAYNNGKSEYLIGAGEWGQYIGNYYGGKTSGYEIRVPGKYFTPNYATAPYIKGDGEGNGWVSNIGTGEGQFNPDNSIKAGNVAIVSDTKAGKYELYGYTVAGFLYDKRPADTDVEVDITFYNSYFESTGTVATKADDATNQTNGFIVTVSNDGHLSNTAKQDSFTLKDSYYLATGNRLMLRNIGWANMIFDGVYADFSGQTTTRTAYYQQVQKDFKFEIKNSFFTGGSAKTYFEGHNDLNQSDTGAKVEAGNKQLILTNNIFKDFSFYGTGTFLQTKAQNFSEMTIKNNYICNSGTSMPLVSGTGTEKNIDPTLKLDISENVLIGISSSGFGSRALTSDSVIKNNYTTVTAGAQGVKLTDTKNISGDYYLDPAKEILASELVISDWAQDNAEITIDGQNISYEINGYGTVQTTGLALSSSKASVKWYSDDALQNEIAENKIATSAYLALEATNSKGFTVKNVYNVTVTAVSDNMFKDKYVAPETDTIKTKIDPSKAFLVDFGSNNIPGGLIYSTTWMGIEYDFVKGSTVFATFAELNNYLATANVEFPHVLLKSVASSTTNYADIKDYGIKAVSELKFLYHGAYYTENYNKVPYVINADGTWSANPDYDVANGIVARWVKAAPKLGAGNLELYGFATTSAFQNACDKNDGRTDETPDMYIENCYAMDTGKYASTPAAPFHLHNDYSRNVNGAKAGSMYIKNTYVESKTKGRSLIYESDQQGTLTFDGLFLDGGGYTLGSQTASVKLTGFELNVINSYIKDSYANTKIAIKATEIPEDAQYTVNIQNNIFENSVFSGDAFIKLDGDFTSVNISGNKIINDKQVDLVKLTDECTTGSALDLKVENNSYLAGINGTINLGTKEVNVISLAGNPFTGKWNAEGTVTGDQLKVVGTDAKNTGYYLTFNGQTLSNPANVIYPMTLTDGVNSFEYAVNGENQTVIETQGGKINLYDYVSGEEFNGVVAYQDTDMEIPYADASAISVSANQSIFVKVTSHDGTTGGAVWTVTVKSAPNVSIKNEAGKGFAGDGDKKDTHTYLSWRGTVTGDQTSVSFVPNGKAVEHRVGAIYLRDNNCEEVTTSQAAINAYVEKLNAGTASLADFDSEVDVINETQLYNSAESKVHAYIYTIAQDAGLTWNDEEAAYSYRYNISVKHGNSRAMIMYVIYYDTNEQAYVAKFSDMIAQKSAPVTK